MNNLTVHSLVRVSKPLKRLLYALLCGTIICYRLLLRQSIEKKKSAISGEWGPLIPMPLVPAAIAVLPMTEKVILWAAETQTFFGAEQTTTNATVTVLYDLVSGDISERLISSTGHNMFCPGTSLDHSGALVVTGGGNENATSIYGSGDDTWKAGQQMNIGRGYHSQATLSDGSIFIIGGSWSGGVGGKNGEMFKPLKNQWTNLPGCLARPLLTNDERGEFCADNHAWLFAWKNESVFQAGPSRSMNWFSTLGEGNWSVAGLRAQNEDSMNGNAVMYDALRGKILTIGGSTSYSGAVGTAEAHVITLSDPSTLPEVVATTKMLNRRVFANSIVLPSGEVLVVGGQSFARQWSDANSSMLPEMWSPLTGRFRSMARMSIPRNYHSVAALLPDATVMVGGGGLCWGPCQDPSVNHLDIQIFRPPYLFKQDGSRAERPSINYISSKNVSVGSSVSVVTDSQTAEFSLIRYSSATHSINTDQRRIQIEAHVVSGEDFTYQVEIPLDPGLVIPGYWMLFAITGARVPSRAETILIRPL